MSGGSAAPIENSPPGIHTIAGGVAPGDGAALGRVGAKSAVTDVAAGTGADAGAELLLLNHHQADAAASVTASAARPARFIS
jgi:hypothetical protein